MTQGWTQNDSFDNWDDVSTEAPEPPDAGFYIATIAKADATKPTSGKGLPNINLTLSVTDVFQGDKLPKPRTVFDNLVVTKDAAFRVKQFCLAADTAPPKSNGADYLPGYASELVGLTVIVQLKRDSYTPKGSVEKKIVARVEKYHTQASAEKAKNGGGEAAANAEAAAEAGAAPRRRRGSA